jgi:L-threonylcarbamoyladenylate synthase
MAFVIVLGGMSEFYYRSVADKLRQGGIIAYPCEGLYGVGCDPLDQAAVMKILKLKQRHISKGLILVASHTDQLVSFVDAYWLEKKELQQTWAGPVTWLCPAKKTVPPWLTGKHSTLAVRVSAHPIIQKIC